MIEALLPADMSAATGAGLMGISFLGSFITAVFGIGGGVMVLAVLASLLPPVALIPIHGVVQLGSNAGRTAIMASHIDRPTFTYFLAGAVLGITIGALAAMVVIDFSPAIVQIAVGGFILWTIFFKPPVFLAHSAWVAGAFSSLLTMFFGATGPFVSAYIRTLGFERMRYVATHASCMTLQHGFKVLAFGFLGFAFGPYIWLILGMIAFGFLGTVIGKRVLMKIDEALFKKVLQGILILLSLRLIWAGATSL